MAIQEANGKIHGKAGSVIYRRWRGLNIVQGLPYYNKSKRTLNTKLASMEFGLASTHASWLRKSLEGFFKYTDPQMPARLVSRVLKSLQHSPGKQRMQRGMHDADLSPLRGFEFNTASELLKMMPVQPDIHREESGRVRVHIPAFDAKSLRVPAEAGSVRLRMALIAYDFREGYCHYLSWHLQRLDLGDKQEINWHPDVIVPEGMIVMVCMAFRAQQVRTVTGEIDFNERDWSPACIVDAWHSEPAQQPLPTRKEVIKHIHDQELFKDYFLMFQSSIVQEVADMGRKLAAQALSSEAPKPPPPGIDLEEESPLGKVFFKDM